jgi:hypothetical protein
VKVIISQSCIGVNKSAIIQTMGRVINPETAGKERTQLMRSIVLAVRELALQTETGDQARDLAAYISLALQAITNTVESSVQAWEKRGYWVKADRFRMEWIWAERLGNSMLQALLQDDWGSVATTAAQIAERSSKVKVPINHRLGKPWEGAWQKLRHENGTQTIKT